MSSTLSSSPLSCLNCGTMIPSGGAFCPRCGARYGATPRPREDFTDGLVAVVKAIIGIAGAFLVAYGGWAGAVAVYEVIPYDTRPFVQAITGIVGGIFLIILAFNLIDRIAGRRQPRFKAATAATQTDSS